MSNDVKTKLIVTSPVFQEGGFIPVQYTCDGENVSPCIHWEGIPAGTLSLIMIMEDRDIPMPQIPLFTWIHWIVCNIPPDITSLPEATPRSKILESGAVQGMTSYRIVGYSGPRPISGIHRYYFTVYAIDTMIDIEPSEMTKKKVLKAIEGHVLAKGVLMGRYRKQKLK